MLSLVFKCYHSINYHYPLNIFTNTLNSNSFSKRKVSRFLKSAIAPAYGDMLKNAAHDLIILDAITL